MRNISTLRLLPLMLSIAGIAHAEGPDFKISGFGTAAVAISDTDEAEFARPFQEAGAGDKLRTGVDSNLGLQATATVNESLSFTAQVLTRKIVEDKYRAELAMAFAKFKLTDKLSVRLGRMGQPTYMISDFRNVGYANTMIRPSNEVYGVVPGGSLDGVDAMYQTELGSTALATQLAVGRSAPEVPGGITSKMKSIVALHVLAERGPLTLRFGYSRTKFSAEGPPFLAELSAGLRAAGFANAAQDFAFQNVTGSFTSVGAIYDEGKLLLQGEYARGDTTTRFIQDSTTWYLLGGYRFGKVMPYAAYADLTQTSGRTYSGVPPTVQPFNAILNGMAQGNEQSTTTLGVRWDFAPSMAFKFQADRVRPRNGPGMLVNAKPGFSGPLTVYAAGVDFVF